MSSLSTTTGGSRATILAALWQVTRLSRNAVREALGRLDVLAVGGSAVAGMVVYATFDSETFYQLTNPEAREDEIFEVVAGGQVGDYPACLVVGLSSALKPPKRLQEEVLYPPS